ncbi:MAG TPA: hypothetical protein H9707_02885 [Candidatus Butyricicoccus avicola]|nr:hypothetical protein [Candidatus Butyricicoccus avicola]
MPILIFWPGVAAPAGVSRETWPRPAAALWEISPHIITLCISIQIVILCRNFMKISFFAQLPLKNTPEMRHVRAKFLYKPVFSDNLVDRGHHQTKGGYFPYDTDVQPCRK